MAEARDELDDTAEHVIELTEVEKGQPHDWLFRVECSCGWVCAGDWTTEEEARAEGDRHAKGEPTEDEDEAAIRHGFESAMDGGDA